jgi:hypothetical protein
MRSKFTRVILLIAGVLAVGAVASSAALATTPEWKFNGKAIKTPLKVEGVWGAEKESAPLKLTDPKLDIVVTCEANALNSISATLAEMTSNEWTSCKINEGSRCETGDELTQEPKGLPWKAELYEEAGKLRERIKGSGGKPIGWNFGCTGTVGKLISSECTATELTAALSNVTAGVDVAFDSKTPKLKCNENGSEFGGTAEGTVAGTELLDDKGLTA